MGASTGRSLPPRGRLAAAIGFVLLLALAACGGVEREGEAPASALAAITEEGLEAHIAALASDEFEGRAPSSAGEEKTIAYLRDAFHEMGLEPGAGADWFQEVPLVSITADPEMTLRFQGADGARELAYESDFMAWTKRVVDRTELRDSELVFVGYGVVAPEYGWDDYEGLDVADRTVVMLVNDPGFATGDPDLFNGRAMTYYGRWTYKFEEAARQGAAGAFIIHDTEPAGYPWEVVSGSWSGPQFDLVAEDANLGRIAVEGWLTLESARDLFRRADQDLDSLTRAAATDDFEAVELSLRASLTIRNEIQRATSRNVLARLPGAERPDEHVVYLAHWDHLGVDERTGEIHNGALDNASGTGGMLEIAGAFTAANRRPDRSVLFLATTAEEQGLLGSKHYAENPVHPLDRTVAAINLDAIKNIWGPTTDITVIGDGMSELEDHLEAVADAEGRTLRADPEPEKGFYYRSDHFEFAKAGVPALYVDGGMEHLEHGEDYLRDRRAEYTAERYHKPADVFDETWNLEGSVEDLRLLFQVGWRLANTDAWPNWQEGTEFRAARDEMMGDR